MKHQQQAQPKKLIVVGGPTAVGKTELSIAIAKHFHTEIISADSRQFYKEMTIGTAVPSKDELNEVPHHFVQHISILKHYDVAMYAKEALQKLDVLFKLKDQVVLSGGSGLFVDAVCNGLDDIPDISPDVRSKVNEIFEVEGIKGLQLQLENLDPEYFILVDKKNPRRLQRALEVCYESGKPYSFYRRSKPAPRPFDIIWVALQRERGELISRIDQRVEKMIVSGLLEEARNLLPFRHLNALNTVGYKELFAYFDDQIDLNKATELIKTNTRQYAKRQMTWMRKNQQYSWFHPQEQEKILKHINLKL